MRFGWMLLLAVSTGCATATEDGPAGVRHVDAAHADSLAVEDASLTDSGADPDATVEDSSTVDIDTGDIDTGEPDTEPEFPDTGAEFPDTTPPPVDSGPTGGSCSWCSSGVCSDEYVDFSCWNDCYDFYGYADCTWDPSASTPCMCHD